VVANLARLLLDTVAPRRCAGCDAISRDPICPDCADRLAAMRVPRPRPVRTGIAFAGFEFEEPVRTILHRGKYGGDRAALRAIAELTSRRLELRARDPRPLIASPSRGRSAQLPPGARAQLLSPPDAVIAVPLGPRRRRQRGYNQSEILARVIAGLHRAPVLDGLERIRETTPQSVRDEQGRRRNVAGAFAWKGSSLAGARVWLVDDVLTTGFTVEAAGEALSGAGASRIDVVIVAEVP
jgi:ComF family protein